MTVRSEIYEIIAKRLRKAVTLVDVRLDEVQREGLELTPLLVDLTA